MPSNLPIKLIKQKCAGKEGRNMADLPDELRALVVDHIGIAVNDLDEASEVYNLLGLEPIHPDEVIKSQNVKVRVYQLGETMLELLEATSDNSPIAKYIAKKGPGIHHFALRVENLESEIARLLELGARFINTEPRAGRANSRIVFLHPKWSKGILIELVEHK